MSQCQEKIASVEVEGASRYRYVSVREKKRSIDVGTYVCYGLRAYRREGNRWQEVAYISDVCADGATVRRLARTCTQGNLDPCHLFDVVEDFLGS